MTVLAIIAVWVFGYLVGMEVMMRRIRRSYLLRGMTKAAANKYTKQHLSGRAPLWGSSDG